MNRTRSFFYNSITAIFYQVVLMITGFITPLVILKFYGSEINGLIMSINQFIVYFSLVELGLSGAAIYALYKPLADKDQRAINGVVAAAKKFYTQSGYLFVLLTIGLAVIYPILVKSNDITPIHIGLLVLILGVNGALEFFTLAKYRVLLSADQKTYIVSIASIVHVIFSTLIIVILSNRKVDIVLLRFVALLSILLRSFILMIYVKLKYKFINYKETPNFQALDKRWDALYLQVLGAVQTGAPILILTLITKDLKVVSVYSIFSMIIVALNGIMSIFISSLSALFGDIIAKREERILQKIYAEFECFYYNLISVVYFTAFIMIMPFIQIYTRGITDINYNLPLVGFLFVLNGVLYNIKTPQGMLVSSAGLFKETKTQTTIQASIVLIGSVILTPVLGIIGVLLASILSNGYRDIDLVLFISKNVTGLPVRKTALRIARLFICIVITWIPFIFIKVEPTNYISWMINSAFVGIYEFIIVSIIGFIFEHDNFISLIKRVKRMIE